MQFIETICAIYKLNMTSQAAVCVCPNRLWRIKTKQGLFAVKYIPNDSFFSHHILQGEAIGEAFANHGIKTITAIAARQNILCEINTKKFLVFQWREGFSLSNRAVNSYYAYSIGNLLAQLHLSKLDLVEISLSRWQNFHFNSRRELFSLIQYKSATKLISNSMLLRLNYWLDHYFTTKVDLNNQTVISHGDLLQSNVIWDKDKSPWLIDWEAAGWIHPQVELVGVLLNWCGINKGSLNLKNFKNILHGYRAAGGEISIDKNILWASLGSWFAWLLFNLRQLIFAEKEVESEIVKTINCIQLLVDSFPILLAGINLDKSNKSVIAPLTVARRSIE